MADLYIAEKLTAAKNIAKTISAIKNKKYVLKQKNNIFEYVVGDIKIIALSGHVINYAYPPKYKFWTMSNLEELLTCKLLKVADPKWQKYVPCKSITKVYIATDVDREGLLIGWNFYSRYYGDVPVSRIKFTAMKFNAIKKALENPGNVNDKIIRATDFRHELDLRLGAVFTRALSLILKLRGKKYMSIGRVQTPLLVLIRDRQVEILNHIPKKYWVLYCVHENKKYTSKKLVKKPDIPSGFKEVSFEVSSQLKKTKRLKPISTDTLLKIGHNLKFTLKKTMKIAQKLYLNGKISYPRTNSESYENLEELKKFAINNGYAMADEYVPPIKGKFDPDHPPVTPTCHISEIKGLAGLELKLMVAISKHFSGVLKAATEYTLHTEKITLKNLKNVELLRQYKSLVKLGCIEIMEGKKTTKIPKKVNLKVEMLKTAPPKRWNQGTLSAIMTKNQIGTKSTKHNIIEILKTRGYIDENCKILKKGIIAANIISKYAKKLATPKFTGHMQLIMNNHINNGIPINQNPQKLLLDTLISMFQSKKKIYRYGYSAESIILKRCERDSNPRKK